MPRYIDAVLLKEKLLEAEKSPYFTEYARLVKIINSIQTADVEEVKHATWECTDDSDNVWKCSGKDGCGEEYMFIEGTPEDNKYKRCPNCGARMEEKE